MPLQFVYDCHNIDWNSLIQLLSQASMRTYTTNTHRKAFENSYRTVFLYDANQLIGCGRLLSDGAYQGVLYDIAIDGHYHGKGLGTEIVSKLIKDLEHINILLYASPGKEPFYEKLGFYHAKTGMVKFSNAKEMKRKGFI